MGWHKDIKIGQGGEQIVFELLRESKLIELAIDVRNDKEFQVLDIDFLALTKELLFIPLEVKTDTMAHRTGNIVYEVYSNKRLKSIGCFEKMKAKYLLYYLIATKEVFVIDVLEFREYVKKNYKEKDVKLKNMGDNAQGYLIKIKELKDNDIIKEVFKYENNQ